MSETSFSAAPPPVRITPELLARHGLTREEYSRIEAALGRAPGLTELGIYSVMWSEHCSYKSSRVHLRRLPTRGARRSVPGSVLQGPGENAGIIDVGGGWACAFKIESHNHPSYIEPFQGAATGVGGILRDIFTMGARPLAVMDSLRFGPIEPGAAEAATVARNHAILAGVVSGIAGYGNCFGVPNLGGETRFEPCYSGNPLVNAFALGLVRHDRIFYGRAAGVGNPVIYVGAKTGRDGIHGATMASEEFREGSEQKRPNVQMGDPFLEKLLLEACLEAMQTGAVIGIQDMGAAGLTCSTCEMGARGGVGLEVELDRVPQRESGMSSYEIMLSESQERMLLVAEKGREQQVLEVFARWGLDAVPVGTVIAEPRLRICHHGDPVADIPNASLTDEAPLYQRPLGEWQRPGQIRLPLDPPAEVLEQLRGPQPLTAALLRMLASPNLCSKRWIWEQYDSMVQTNTVAGPGGEAGVMRIKGTGGRDSGRGTAAGEECGERGLAMALAGNGRWCYLDPALGAMHAVAEAARKVACTGATPVAATNCLNFGNPEKPEIMRQLSDAIDGIARACTALGTPITGGNVSLYNETRGEGIYPTPVVGVVGLLEDVTTALPAGFRRPGDAILLLAARGHLGAAAAGEALRAFGSGAFASTVLGSVWGCPPALDLDAEAELESCLARLAAARLVHSACDVDEGGLAVALARAAMANGVGVAAEVPAVAGTPAPVALFAPMGTAVLLSCPPGNVAAVASLVQGCGHLGLLPIGTAGGPDVLLRLAADSGAAPQVAVACSVAELRKVWEGALESALLASPDAHGRPGGGQP